MKKDCVNTTMLRVSNSSKYINGKNTTTTIGNLGKDRNRKFIKEIPAVIQFKKQINTRNLANQLVKASFSLKKSSLKVQHQ